MAKHKFSPKAVKTSKQLTPIDDLMFQKMCESKAVCQELISTILDQDVKVIEVVPQCNVGNLQGRSVRLDCLCRLKDGTFVNIEVQKTDNDNHEFRVRYNASVVTANMTPKGSKFKNIARVIVIYITNFDIYGDGFPIYHIDRVERENGKVRNNGFEEIYVNTIAKNYDNALFTKISDLMDLFIDREKLNMEYFPEFSKRKNMLINTTKGENEMSDIVEQFAKECVQEALMDAFFDLVEHGNIRITLAAKKANMTVDEFKAQMQMKGYTVPQRSRKKTETVK